MRLVLLAALIAVQATCSGSCNTSQGGAPMHHLVFTGPVAGTLSKADADCRNYVDATQLNVLLTGSLDGKPLTFNIQVNQGYKGAGAYPVGTTLDGAANLRLQVGTYVGSSGPNAGTLTINPDGKSGELDADLSDSEHVKGTFACAEVVRA